MIFALDLETTGLNTAIDRVVQIGIAATHADGEMIGWSSLANPRTPGEVAAVSISAAASAVNGLRDDDVKLAPHFPAVWCDALRFVHERTDGDVCVLSWNGWGFDWPLLFVELARYGLPRPLWRFLDLKPYAAKPASLSTVCERYSVVLDRASNHDAGRDAAAVLGVYDKMRRAGHCPDIATIAREQRAMMIGR